MTMSKTQEGSGRESRLQEKLRLLPAECGVYKFYDSQGALLYVGKANSLKTRVRSYFQAGRDIHPRIQRMISRISDLEIIITANEVESLLLEANLIKELKPRYNVLLKDDKSYPYIVVTNEEFPRVFFTRRVIRDGSKYFGPYTSVATAKVALKGLREIFPIRSCDLDLTEESIAKGKFSVCLDYQIHKCEGPCEGIISRKHYGEMIEQIRDVLCGKTEHVSQILRRQMDALARALRFEEASRVRDRLQALAVYEERQRVEGATRLDCDVIAVAISSGDACGVLFKMRSGKLVGNKNFFLTNTEDSTEEALIESILQRYYTDEVEVPARVLVSALPQNVKALSEWLGTRSKGCAVTVPEDEGDRTVLEMVRQNARLHLHDFLMNKTRRGEMTPASVSSLQRDLRLDAPPLRIECFDISHFQGSDTVASMVVFVDGKPRRSEYRKFKIRDLAQPDDFESMRQVIRRRFEFPEDRQFTTPNLVVIDGGKGQLAAAAAVMDELSLSKIPVISLAKRLEEVYIRNSAIPLDLPRTSLSLRLLQQIRDEAHRFAVTYHRSLRSKRLLHNELTEINGIGQKSAQRLLEKFGSIQALKQASVDQLAEVVGKKNAERIMNYFTLRGDL